MFISAVSHASMNLFLYMTRSTKEEVWQKIEDEYNEVNDGPHRNYFVLREAYRKLRDPVVKKLTTEKKSRKTTGGGSETVTHLSAEDHMVAGLLGNRLTGDPSEFDGDQGILQVCVDMTHKCFTSVLVTYFGIGESNEVHFTDSVVDPDDLVDEFDYIPEMDSVGLSVYEVREVERQSNSEGNRENGGI